MPLAIIIAVSALLAGALGPARAQQAGTSWQPLIPDLRAKLAAQPDPDVAFRLAMVYAHEGNLIDGWHTLKQVDQLTGGEKNREPAARKIIANASGDIQQNPHNLLARYTLAFASWFAGDPGTSLREFQEITRQEPRNAMNHGYLGYIYSTRKDAKNTIAEWETGVRLDPNNSVLHYMLGSAYYKTGRTRDAIGEFKLAYRDRTLYNYITRGEEP
jgi:tetratricopeptide (TPR) repeat protein